MRFPSAQAKLRQDQQGLARARSQADTTKSAQTSKAKDAAYLLAKADAANSKALSLVGQATDVDKTLHDSLAQAKETKTSHQASNDAALASWTHRHRVRIDDVRALRAVTNSCRAAGVRDAAIAAGLTATALLLGLAPAVTGRRRLHPRNSL